MIDLFQTWYQWQRNQSDNQCWIVAIYLRHSDIYHIDKWSIDDISWYIDQFENRYSGYSWISWLCFFLLKEASRVSLVIYPVVSSLGLVINPGFLNFQGTTYIQYPLAPHFHHLRSNLPSRSNFTTKHGLSMSYVSNDNQLCIALLVFAFNLWFIDCCIIAFDSIDNSCWINYTIKDAIRQY